VDHCAILGWLLCNIQLIVVQHWNCHCKKISPLLCNTWSIAAKYLVHHCAILSPLLRNSLLTILSQLLRNTWSNCCHSSGSRSGSSLTQALLARFTCTRTTSTSATTPTQSKVHPTFVCNWVTIYRVIALALHVAPFLELRVHRPLIGNVTITIHPFVRL